MSFDHCLSLLSLKDKLPVDEIRATAKEYEGEGLAAGAAMERAVTEHLDEARRQEAQIVATVKEKFVASGGKLPERETASVEQQAMPDAPRAGVTDTPAFRKWFGDSVVRSEDGKPLVVYHATTKDFDVFNRNAESIFGYGEGKDSGGIFFDADPKMTDYYASPKRSGARVIPAFLRIENPARLPANQSLEKQAADLRAAEASGHDGAILGGKEYVVFKPEQVKSATGNTGDFDPVNPDIRYSTDHPMGREAAREVDPLVQSLADSGAIVLHKDASTLPIRGKIPRGVQALTTRDGTIHVVADALGGNGRGIVLHEAFHAGGESLIGSEAWGKLNERLGELYKSSESASGSARAFFELARERVEAAKAKGAVGRGMEAEEFGAYAIEEYAKAPPSIRKWVDDLVGAVKSWVLARFGKQLGDVTPAQLMALSKLALLDARASRAAEMSPAYSADRRADERGPDRRIHTVQVDGERRPIEDSQGRQIGKSVAEQIAFWRNYDGPVDEQGRPIRGDDAADARYSVAATEPEPVTEAHRSALSKMIGVPKELLKSAAHTTRMLVMPMAAGAEQAMVMAKDFANHNRRAAMQWTAFDKVLKNSYSDEQLKKMWVAADQENDLRREGRTSTTEGLASLSAGERKTVELLHAYGEQLWTKAKEAGLVAADSEGVHYWTPRVAARMVAEGGAESIRQPGGEFSKDARNLRTSASSTKQRRYETTAESEAALKAKLGDDAEYVKNIRVMPMAMAQLEKAIAGRTLVNQIKAHGKLAGDDLVRDEAGPNFVTFDHPALKQWRPKMDWQPVERATLRTADEVRPDGVYRDGERLASYRVRGTEIEKLMPLEDSNGKPVLESFPLFVRKDFAGPLKSVFTTAFNNEGVEKTYRALMELKGASMSMIMFSPMTHNAVIWGKAMPSMVTAMGWKNNLKNIATGGIYSYVVGHKIRQDHAEMARLVEGGLVPMGGRGMNPDLPAIHDGIKPGRSILARALGAAVDPVSPRAGDAVRRGVDAAGHFWHETLLWDRIGDMQAGMAVQLRAHMMDQGVSEYAATRIATHFANRYAGAIPQEAISQAAHVTMNILAFSKSFTLTNVGAMKDPLTGLPKEIQAQIKLHMYEAQKALGKTELEALDAAGKELKQAQSVTRKKALMILAVDFAAMAAISSLVQAWLAGQNGKEFVDDLKERAHTLGAKLDEENPLSFLGPMLGKVGLPLAFMRHPFENLEHLSQTSDNPHGKQERVRIGEDEQGNSYYLRLPTGKVVEEMKAYTNMDTMTSTLKNKMSPLAGSALEVLQNQDFQGRRVYRPDETLFTQIGKSVGHMMKAQAPFDDVVALKHILAGDNDQGSKVRFAGRDWNMDEAKLAGSMTGLSVGKVSGGDAVAEMRYQNREQQADLRDVLPDVRDLALRGKTDEAMELLEQAGQTPKEAQRILRQIDQPGRISKQQMKKFNAHADESERDRLEKMRQRAMQ